jgi:outer membrane protein assembly factor BamE (lipoprotein component of BamABCDE complex)
MALITCPECNHELFDQTLSCPHCGYPLRQDNSLISLSAVITQDAYTTATSQATLTKESQTLTNSEYQKNNHSIKWFVIGTVVIVILIALFAFFSGDNKVTKDNVDFDSMYNTELGAGIRLGQSKSEVKEVLGAPSKSYERYGIQISYMDGKIASIYIENPNDRWITKNGVKIGSTGDELITLLGKPTSLENSNKLWFYHQDSYTAVFEVTGNQVVSIFIYSPEYNEIGKW